MYVTGKISGNQISVHYFTAKRAVPEGIGEVCLKLVHLREFKSAELQGGEVLGVYTDPNGAQFAVAAKLA